MKIHQAAWLAIKVLAAVLSAIVSVHALYSATRVDLRIDVVVTSLYCLFPALSFVVFLFVRSARAEVVAQIILFLGYLVTASMLAWRNCSAIGYCTTVSATVTTVFRSSFILASFGVAVLTLIAWVLGDSRKRTAVS
jgi:hypothetical protein